MGNCQRDLFAKRLNSQGNFIEYLKAKYHDVAIIVEKDDRVLLQLRRKNNPVTSKLNLDDKENPVFTIKKQKDKNLAYHSYNAKKHNLLDERYDTYNDEYAPSIIHDMANNYGYIKSVNPDSKTECKVRQKSKPSYIEKSDSRLKENIKLASKIKSRFPNVTIPEHKPIKIKKPLKLNKDSIDKVDEFIPLLISDIIAGRIIISSVDGSTNEDDLIKACYCTVNNIISRYKNDENSDFEICGIKDYISEPKESGYQSIHILFRNKKNPDCTYELQIRTERMEIASKTDPKQSHVSFYKERPLNENSSLRPPKYTFIEADESQSYGRNIIPSVRKATHKANFYKFYDVSLDDYREQLTILQPIINEVNGHYSYNRKPRSESKKESETHETH